MLEEGALSAALTSLQATPSDGVAYRVIPARYHLTALSAISAMKRGGRYNPRGRLEALYLSDSPMTALQEVEAVQVTSGKLISRKFSPKTLLSVEYQLQRLLNLSDERVQVVLETSTLELIQPWVLEQTDIHMALTQRLGLAAVQASIEALRVPSAKNPSSSNLVIYPRNLMSGSSLRVYDDSGFIDARLP